MVTQVQSELVRSTAGQRRWRERPRQNVPIWEEDPAEWWRVFEVNVLDLSVLPAVLPVMVERGSGRIVNVGSGMAYLPAGPGARARLRPQQGALYRFGRCWRHNSLARASPSSRSAPGPSAPR
jgi:NAD(P)-dependent dehydrogenase (short-subunit alcohol dehydrogenase family)